MKKGFLAIIAAILFVGCSKKTDADLVELDDECESCIANGQKIEICPSKSASLENTFTVTGGAEEQTITQSDLDELGLTPKQYVEALCANAENQ